MNGTDLILTETARIIGFRGLHTGDQFAANTGRRACLDAPLDICAAVYLAATGNLPSEFFTDEVISLAIIGASAPAMAAIRAISDALDSEACETEIEPGTRVPDYIEHVSNWAATASPIHPKRPPTVDEVIGCILRAAQAADQRTATHTTAA
jgi:hypothetical protein